MISLVIKPLRILKIGNYRLCNVIYGNLFIYLFIKNIRDST